MCTYYSEIINDHAMVLIDDSRLIQELQKSPAGYMRKMALYMKNAIPLFNKPKEAVGWLKHTNPVFDDYLYAPANNPEEGDLIIETGKTGYELVSAVYLSDDGYGGIQVEPVSGMEYDAETGNVTIHSPETGKSISIDFYTDGYFERELSEREKNILGMCVQYVWESRFANNYLNMQPKIKDRSFDAGSESNHIRVNNERLKLLKDNLDQELNDYEQGIYYNSVVIHSGWMSPVENV